MVISPIQNSLNFTGSTMIASMVIISYMTFSTDIDEIVCHLNGNKKLMKILVNDIVSQTTSFLNFQIARYPTYQIS